MKNNNIFATIFYLASIICFLSYLITKYNMLMFFGGIFLATASIIVMATSKKK